MPRPRINTKAMSAERHAMAMATDEPASFSASGKPWVFMPKSPVTSVGGRNSAVNTDSVCGRGDGHVRNLLVGRSGLQAMEDRAQARELSVQPDRVPADRPEPPPLPTNALVEDVILDLVELIGQAGAGLRH